jgi:mRNA-degrading endonuclease RelE of RelBE toxin-antitoxin system
LSARFDNALAKITSWLSARRKSEPHAPRVYMTQTFLRQLESVEKNDRMMAENIIKMLSADPDKPKRGRNVDGTRCHKTDLAHGNRPAMYRVLYYHRKEKNEVYLIHVFPKSDRDNITAEQAKKINYVTAAINNGAIIGLISLDEHAP